ncbi:39624_t:CDS:1 [Gigaspora margarita]|uniref:39624_t:CDS:1 n=1 Tax=Gigaspora margarita TaxID=4874 RepID=A0ABN7WIG2_GIGMA|nr:39624_t:CDS:1 [Gigaspora margarita]
MVNFFHIDNTYNQSLQDTFDSILNNLMPVLFILLLSISQDENSSWKTNFLPIFDDFLYNTITWVIPLIVSIIYNLHGELIFAICNAIPHIICVVISYCKSKRLNVSNTDKHDEIGTNDPAFLFGEIFISFAPILVIPIFWLFNIPHIDDPTIKQGFVIVFSLAIIYQFTLIIILYLFSNYIHNKLISIITLLSFCTPGTLQTILIMVAYPVNSSFIKCIIFILGTFLSRISTYFAGEFPKNLRATPTTYTLYIVNQFRSNITQFKPTFEDIESRVTKLEENVITIRQKMTN